MKRITLVLAALAVLGLVFGGCKKDKPPQDQPPPADEAKKPEPPPPDEAKKPEPPPPDEAKEEGKGEPAADGVGVPECDDFLKKYESCVGSKVPEAARATFAKAVGQWRDAWKKAAGTEAGKKALAASCKQIGEAQKKALASYKCEW